MCLTDTKDVVQKKRIEWIDVARFIGMYAIFIGHYLEINGEYLGGWFLGYFVWKWHVPLMFFLSGCLENNSKWTEKFSKKVGDSTKSISIPYYFFGMLAMVFALFYCNYNCHEMAFLLKDYLLGTIRNTFFVTQLWFLTCLFIMKIVFSLLTTLKNRYLVIFSGVLVWGIGILLGCSNSPVLPYNLDSSFYYLIYYILGFALYPQIIKVFSKKYLREIIFTPFALYSLGVYFMNIKWGGVYFESKLISETHLLMQVLILIVFICFISYYLQNFKILTRLGSHSLYLCANEGIVNFLYPSLFGIIGIDFSYSRPIDIAIMALIRILTIEAFFYPWQERMLKSCTRVLPIFSYSK